MNNRMETFDPFENELAAALSAPDGPDFLRDLRRRMAAEPAPVRTRAVPLRRLAFALGAVAVILAAVLIAGPDRVLAAFRSLFGYIPGIGYVSPKGGLRTIAAPVSQTRDGVTVTVEQAVFDSQRSILVFSEKDIPWEARPTTEDNPGCTDQPTLRTAPGQELTPTGLEGNGWGSGFRTRVVFGAIPAEAASVVFRVPCLEDTLPGAAPVNWELTLPIVPMAAGTEILPVLEIPTVTPGSPSSSTWKGIHLQAERVVSLTQGWRVEGSIHYAGPGVMQIYQPVDSDLRLSDAKGNNVAFSTSMPDSGSASYGSVPWALEIPYGDYTSPLTLEVTALQLQLVGGSAFTVDLGKNPAPGTVFQLDQELQVEGLSVTIRSLTVNGKIGGEGSYDLTVDLPADTVAIGVNTPDHPSRFGGGNGLGPEFQLSIGYDDLKAGVQRFVVDSITVREPGSLKTTFDLPERAASAADPEVPCLAADAWDSLSAGSAPLPEGLSGTLIVAGTAKDGFSLPGLFSIHPDGTGRVGLPNGSWAGIGFDANRAVYVDAAGLHLYDREHGDTLVSNAGPNILRPLFSPDGLSLAFTDLSRDPGIYVLRLDGHEKHKLPGTDASVSAAGWMPDNRRIVVIRDGENQTQVQILDAETGVAEDGFTIENSQGGFAALSPRGDRLAFSVTGFGLSGYGVFSANLDGSNRRFIAAPEAGIVEAGTWSPDGKWLVIIHTAAADPRNLKQLSVLVDPDQCQVIPFPFGGAVYGWGMGG